MKKFNINRFLKFLVKYIITLPFGGFDFSPILFILITDCPLEFPIGTSDAGSLN